MATHYIPIEEYETTIAKQQTIININNPKKAIFEIVEIVSTKLGMIKSGPNSNVNKTLIAIEDLQKELSEAIQSQLP